MSELSEEEARNLIDDIRKKHGGITAEQRDHAVASDQQDLLDVLHATRRQFAESLEMYYIFTGRETG